VRHLRGFIKWKFWVFVYVCDLILEVPAHHCVLYRESKVRGQILLNKKFETNSHAIIGPE